MLRAIKYSIVIALVIVLVAGSVYFYLTKDGYQVTFNSNGGSVVASIYTGLTKTIEAPNSPTREGYKFVGWYLDGERFDFTSSIQSNITLTAYWEEIIEEEYEITFDTLGGEELEAITVKKDDYLTNLPIPQKEGYEFIGWYYHNKEVNESTKVNGNMVLVAKYKIIT